MISTKGIEIKSAYTYGKSVSRIYSYGDIVYERDSGSYKIIDYIESNGRQYIDLNYIPMTNSGVTEITVTPKSTTGTIGMWGFISVTNPADRISMGIYNQKWFVGCGVTVSLSSATIDKESTIVFNRKDSIVSVDGFSTNFTNGSPSMFYSSFLFGRNDGNNEPFGTSFSGLIHSVKEYDDEGNITMWFRPAIEIATNESGMLDVINNIFYRNMGTGEFIPSTSSEDKDTYMDLEYVQCTGNQWIDTGLPNTMDLIFEMEYMIDLVDTPEGDGGWVIGGRINPNKALGIFVGISGFFNMYGAGSLSQLPNITEGEWVDMYFSRTSLTTTINGTTNLYAVSGGVLIPDEYETNVLIGKNQVNYAGTGNDPRNLWGKIKRCKITDATTMNVLREYIPRKSNSSGVAGLYDLINDKFEPSFGPEEFIGVSDLDIMNMAYDYGIMTNSLEESIDELKKMNVNV